MTKTDELILELFRDASNYPLDYVFTLLRVRGIESYKSEPLKELARNLKSGKASEADIDSCEDLWVLLTNLSRLQRKIHYMPFPPLAQKDGSFREAALNLHVTGSVGQEIKKLSDSGETVKLMSFIARFLEHYHGALKEFTDSNHTVFPINVNQGMFEIFEILASKEGLNGFNVYFSNDTKASFRRTNTGTEGFNIIPDNGIGFMVGDNDSLIKAWRMEGKWLYEVGLSGRYNDPEEWKPLEYKGSSDLIQKEAKEKSEDERIQNVFFYMLATGYPVIEFAARTAIKLPKKETEIEGDIHLLRVGDEAQLANEFIYDGTLRLKDTSVEGVRIGIESIQRSMESLGFAFDKEIRWRLKYGMYNHTRGSAQPNEKDLKFLNQLIENSNEEKELAIDAAINWYNLGNTIQNPLNAFLCYHISIEGLAAKLAQGKLKASASYGLAKESKPERKKRIKAVFDNYYAAYYSTDIEKMIKESYFEGIVPIKHYLEQALTAVFGQGNPVLNDYFEKDEGIWDVRGKLVHEVYSEWHPEEYAKVQRKLHDLQQISKAFITRVALQIPAGEKRPTWSGMHAMSSSMDNPTSTMIVTHIQLMSGKDWKIKAEWID